MLLPFNTNLPLNFTVRQKMSLENAKIITKNILNDIHNITRDLFTAFENE